MSTPIAGPEQRTPVDGSQLVEYWTAAGTVRGPLPLQEAETLAGREQAMVADPVPLGLAGFAASLFTISVCLCGWFGIAAVGVAIPVSFVYGGIGVFLAGMWAFRRGNVLIATTFSSLGCFFASFALLLWLTKAGVIPAQTIASGPAYVAGVFVLMFALIMAYLGVAALGQNRMLAWILLFLAFAFLADGTGLWIGGQNPVIVIGGYAGILVAVMAFYESAAIAIDSAMRRSMLPTFGVGAGANMMPTLGAPRLPRR